MYSAFDGGKRKKKIECKKKNKEKARKNMEEKIKEFSKIYYIFTLLISLLNPNCFLGMKRGAWRNVLWLRAPLSEDPESVPSTHIGVQHHP